METHGPGPRPGDRDNGLQAERYVVLADLDPRVADALLRHLADAGIAAYVGPTPGERGGYGDNRLSSRLTDRMWVDARAEPDARELLAREQREDEETTWRAIVEGFSASTSAEVPPWPVTEDIDGPPLVQPAPTYAVRPEDDFVAEPIDLDAEDHFVPPPPPPAPRPAGPTVLALVLLLAGVALAVVPSLLGESLDRSTGVLALLLVLGGFGTLIYRMKDGPPHDSGPDDGAVV